MDSQTTDIMHFVDIFPYNVTNKALEIFPKNEITCDFTIQKFAKLLFRKTAYNWE